jgi:hypothetical protein
MSDFHRLACETWSGDDYGNFDFDVRQNNDLTPVYLCTNT